MLKIFICNCPERIINQAQGIAHSASGYALTILSIKVIVILLQKLRSNYKGKIKFLVRFLVYETCNASASVIPFKILLKTV